MIAIVDYVRRRLLRSGALAAAGLYVAPSIAAQELRAKRLARIEILRSPFHKMKPEAFARRPLRGARIFVAGALYPGYRLDGEHVTNLLEWLDEYRFWQNRLDSPYIPYIGYRFDLATYSQEPESGWKIFDDAYVRVPAAEIDAKLERFRAAGWKVRTVKTFGEWEPKLRRNVNGVEMAVLPYCKGEANRGEQDEGRQKRCGQQAAVVDPQAILGHVIPHCLEAVKLFGVGGVGMACKRAYYSPNQAGHFKKVFGPDPDEDPMGGPLLAPPFAPGHWDSAWMALAEALRKERIAVVKQERPIGYPDGTGATWLTPLLRTHVTDQGGPEPL